MCSFRPFSRNPYLLKSHYGIKAERIATNRKDPCYGSTMTSIGTIIVKLKSGWHDFQYFDHKSSWRWDWWEMSQKILFYFIQD